MATSWLHDTLTVFSDSFGKKKIFRNTGKWLLYTSILAFLVLIYDLGFGYYSSASIQHFISLFYLVCIVGFTAALLFQIGAALLANIRRRALWGEYLMVILTALASFFLLHYPDDASVAGGIFTPLSWARWTIFIVFLVEISRSSLDVVHLKLNPAILFTLSFVMLITLGTLFLMMPAATHAGISWIDALFTITSAASVTGLGVLDTGNYFTRLGQVIILFFIQLGGLGVMTITSFFGYFFTRSSSLQNQMLIKDFISADHLGEVFQTLYKIIAATFFIELMGAIVIYINIDENVVGDTSSRMFFALFHAISAFCNAGFALFSDQLYDIRIRYNYWVHATIMALIILGGLGFPILIVFYKLLKTKIKNLLSPLLNRPKIISARIISLHARVVLLMSSALWILGTLYFYVTEYNNVLAPHSGFGKVVNAFFMAVTPRTAGFNSVPIADMLLPSLLITIFLMWVGAAPAGTGGGIKVTTFAVGTLNIINIVRGKDRIELFGREISDESIRRSFAVISLSLIIIGFSIFALCYFEPDKDVFALAFEAFSAYGTVGLSVGITPQLSNIGKLIIIATMFIGRVGAFTILVGLLSGFKVRTLKYRYPKEDIYIT